MSTFKIFSISVIICFILTACALSVKDSVDEDTSVPSSVESETLKSENLKSETENEDLWKQKVIMARFDKMSSRITDLEQQITEEKSTNTLLNQKTDMLINELTKRDTVIHLQENVIKLLDDSEKTIETSLKAEIDIELKELEKFQEKAKFIFYAKDLFNPNTVEISEKGKELLISFADSLKNNKQQMIVVEGHTDDVPIDLLMKKKYSTNWEVSLARAGAVVRFLQEEVGLAPERLMAVGYGPYRPIASNKTEEGRMKNHRVEIILSAPM